jgi:hypothetical protein
MKNLQPGTALRNGERERILIRCREALAGYRGAALRYRFGAGIVMAVLKTHLVPLSVSEFAGSGCSAGPVT